MHCIYRYEVGLMKKTNILLTISILLIIGLADALIINNQVYFPIAVPTLNATSEILSSNLSFYVNNESSFTEDNLICQHREIDLGDFLCEFKTVRKELIDANLVSYWKFDRDDSTGDSKGTNTLIEGGGILHEINNGSILDAYRFDGGSDGDANNFLRTTFSISTVGDDFTYTAWIKTSAGDDDKIISTNGRHPLGIISPGVLRVCLDGSCSQGTTSIIDNEWHFLAVSGGVSDSFGYVDGVLEILDTDAPADITGIVLFGSNFDSMSFFFSGIIDEIRLYDKSLSGDEIRSLYVYGEGEYNLKVNDTNTSDTESSTQDLIIDLTKPLINDLTRQLEEKNDYPFNIVITDSYNTTLNLTVDGEAALFVPKNNTLQNFTFTITLSDGRHDYLIISEDLAGNVVTKLGLLYLSKPIIYDLKATGQLKIQPKATGVLNWLWRVF